MFAIIKHLHVTAVVLSLILFLVRWIGSWVGWVWQEQRWLRVLPHVNDTLLLAAGLTMVILMGGFPSWIGVKLGALMLYIMLGWKALRSAHPGWRTGWGLSALLVYAFIISVAITQSPWGMLRGL